MAKLEDNQAKLESEVKQWLRSKIYEIEEERAKQELKAGVPKEGET